MPYIGSSIHAFPIKFYTCMPYVGTNSLLIFMNVCPLYVVMLYRYSTKYACPIYFISQSDGFAFTFQL